MLTVQTKIGGTVPEGSLAYDPTPNKGPIADENGHIHPGYLQDATDDQAGKIATAAAAEIIAGLSNTKAATPLALEESGRLPSPGGKRDSDLLSLAAGALIGNRIVSLITQAGYSLAPATGSSTLDGIADGASYKRIMGPQAAALNTGAVASQAPFAVPIIVFPDLERARLERASGGRATIFYSADGLKTPCEVVWLDAFTLADVASGFSVARANSTAYAIGQMLMANNQLYEVTSPGTTGSSAPVYPTVVGNTVADGTATLTLQVNAYNDIHPAFSVAGVKKAGLWIGRFKAGVSGTKPIVVAGQLPANLSIDNMRTYMTNFGNGCRPMTHWDWSAVWMDAVRKGIVPVGNTNYGRSHKTTESKWGGIRGDNARPGDTSIGTNPYTRGGSAGSLWTHNREDWGVHDFVGNQVQWCDGAKIMDGQLYIAAHDNDASLLSLAGEESWLATGVFLDSPVAGNDSGADNLGTPRIANAVTNYTASVAPPRDNATIKADARDLDYAAATWSAWSVQASFDSVNFLMRRSAFLQGTSPKLRSAGASPLSASEGYSYVRNNGERFASCGGGYSSGSNAGPASRPWYYRRSSPNAVRPVFVP